MFKALCYAHKVYDAEYFRSGPYRLCPESTKCAGSGTGYRCAEKSWPVFDNQYVQSRHVHEYLVPQNNIVSCDGYLFAHGHLLNGSVKRFFKSLKIAINLPFSSDKFNHALLITCRQSYPHQIDWIWQIKNHPKSRID